MSFETPANTGPHLDFERPEHQNLPVLLTVISAGTSMFAPLRIHIDMIVNGILQTS